jgi:alkylation response protein AidB-like acyl-CoA dehydrogenase
MDLSLDESQEILSSTFSDLLEKECPTSHVRDCEETGFSPELWDRYVELGASGMGLPESVDGLGMELLELGLVATCGGRVLAPGPFVEVAASGRLLAAVDPDNALLAKIAEGEARISLAPARRNPVLGTSGGTGEGRLIPFGSVVDHVIALEGDELVLVSGADGRSSTQLRDVGSGALSLWDLSDRGDSTRQVLAKGTKADQAFRHGMAEWKLLTGFSLVGLAQQALEIGAEYARERIQFGVPIGGFQAIAHPLADCATRVDGAELLAWEAAWAEAAEPERFEALAAMAFAWASQTAQRTAGISLHTHGGYGCSLEYDIQIYYRRACASSLVAGGAREELVEVADLCFAPTTDARMATDGGEA